MPPITQSGHSAGGESVRPLICLTWPSPQRRQQRRSCREEAPRLRQGTFVPSAAVADSRGGHGDPSPAPGPAGLRASTAAQPARHGRPGSRSACVFRVSWARTHVKWNRTTGERRHVELHTNITTTATTTTTATKILLCWAMARSRLLKGRGRQLIHSPR